MTRRRYCPECSHETTHERDETDPNDPWHCMDDDHPQPAEDTTS